MCNTDDDDGSRAAGLTPTACRWACVDLAGAVIALCVYTLPQSVSSCPNGGRTHATPFRSLMENAVMFRATHANLI